MPLYFAIYMNMIIEYKTIILKEKNLLLLFDVSVM